MTLHITDAADKGSFHKPVDKHRSELPHVQDIQKSTRQCETRTAMK